MRFVIAPDKFKGSLSALEAAEAMGRGVRRVDPHIEIDLVPMADGGEGTVPALVAATGGSLRKAVVTGPLGDPVVATFGILGDGKTAVIEMASASGLVLVPAEQRDPWRATTRGTGELLLAACQAGADRVIMGIGGSATNDGGAGLGQALGYRLLDADDRDLGPGGGALGRLAKIIPPRDSAVLKLEKISVACDVSNPLCGPQGASAVYGPQKGASPDMVASLDLNLDHFAKIVLRDLRLDLKDLPGAGAAGGLGAGLVAFARGRLEGGVDLILDTVNMKQRINNADLCLTGEGSLDRQSAYGKTAVGVARLARSLGCPTLAIAGAIGLGAEAVLEQGITAYFSICPGPMAREAAMAQGAELLEHATAQAVRAFLAGRVATGDVMVSALNRTGDRRPF
jgi:glycerate kinase